MNNRTFLIPGILAVSVLLASGSAIADSSSNSSPNSSSEASSALAGITAGFIVGYARNPSLKIQLRTIGAYGYAVATLVDCKKQVWNSDDACKYEAVTAFYEHFDLNEPGEVPSFPPYLP